MLEPVKHLSVATSQTKRAVPIFCSRTLANNRTIHLAINFCNNRILQLILEKITQRVRPHDAIQVLGNVHKFFIVRHSSRVARYRLIERIERIERLGESTESLTDRRTRRLLS